MDMNDLRLLMGGRGDEQEVSSFDESPTFVVDKAWDAWWDVAENALAAYMLFTKSMKKPHSYVLGLDILATAETDPSRPGMAVDIRPTILEGPCCNSYPACPNFYPSRLYGRAVKAGHDPDSVEQPHHPTKIVDRIVQLHKDVWKAMGNKGKPVCGVFTLPYPGSEEETAHNITLNKMKEEGLEAYRITPDEKPEVRDGRIWVNGRPMDICWRRIERKHVPVHYGEELGRRIIHDTPKTVWINPWEVDDWRSKTIEEKCFREYEKATGKRVSRPATLLGAEITPENVRGLLARGGFAHKKFDSTGGKGVFLHYYKPAVGDLYDALFGRYDGRHMTEVNEANVESFLAGFRNFSEDAAIQQMRMIDSRACGTNRLVYDSRVNVIYDPLKKRWDFLSGISRVVPCGPHVGNGNSLLTNVSSGASMTALVVGRTKRATRVEYGEFLSAMMRGGTEWSVPAPKSCRCQGHDGGDDRLR